MIFYNIKIRESSYGVKVPNTKRFPGATAMLPYSFKYSHERAQLTYWVQHKSSTDTEIFTSGGQCWFRPTTIIHNQLSSSMHPKNYPGRSADIISNYLTRSGSAQHSNVFKSHSIVVYVFYRSFYVKKFSKTKYLSP